MSVTLAPEVAARLRQRASNSGINEDDLANALLTTALDLEELGSQSEIDAIEEGLRACENGRERPFAEFIAEHRAQYPGERR